MIWLLGVCCDSLPALLAAARYRPIRIRHHSDSEWAPLIEIAAHILAYGLLALIAWIADRFATRRCEREQPALERQLREARRIIANRVR